MRFCGILHIFRRSALRGKVSLAYQSLMWLQTRAGMWSAARRPPSPLGALLALAALAAVGLAGAPADAPLPVALLGLQPWVRGPHGQTLVGNRIPATYLTQAAAVEACATHAAAIAQRHRWGDAWSYGCCTVTPTSACHTTVR